MSRILVVEDESAIAELLAINLRHAGHEVTIAADAGQAQAAVDAVLPDLVVLDWMLPGESGLVLARRWRGHARTRELPVIMLTARAAEPDKVAGLDAGADDYLAKPFSVNELLARIRALLRRRAPQALDDAVEAGALRLDPATRRVTCAGREVRIGPTEFRLLHFFMAHPERVHSRAQLLDRVWGDHVFIEERTVDVHVKRLREALEPVQCARLIETVRGAGYRFALQIAPAEAPREEP
jgi:two-component system phosphate regulon response regulator PhoB